MAAAWPVPTPPPIPRRQIITDQSEVAASMETCEVFSGNEVFSCFPTAGTVIPQAQWASFVWNSREPEFTQTNLVDIFLLRADSGETILHLVNQSNPTDRAGLVHQQVNDTWFGAQGLDWNGKNVSFPFQWAVIRSDKTLDGNQASLPIFTAVQTTVLDSVAAAQTSASLASASASSASAASASSASAASASAAASRSGSAPNASSSSAAGNVQHAAAAAAFPRWAIAVIVVLGFLAIAATCLLAFLILRRLRRARARTSSPSSRAGSMGSASPMIAREQEMAQRYADAPLLPPPVLVAHVQGTPSALTHDGASTISDSGGPFSGADAAIMADAFRKMLRKPDFAGRPVEEGESPEGLAGDADPTRGNFSDEGGDEGEGFEGMGGHEPLGRTQVLSRELAEEGRDIRSVSSSRGVKVEGAEHEHDLTSGES